MRFSIVLPRSSAMTNPGKQAEFVVHYLDDVSHHITSRGSPDHGTGAHTGIGNSKQVTFFNRTHSVPSVLWAHARIGAHAD
eukprot:m.480493 g.480493  ORF g.480493 m.480493 type:complete len:81 (+) comp21707_c0_seq32:3418-3660(+)